MARGGSTGLAIKSVSSTPSAKVSAVRRYGSWEPIPFAILRTICPPLLTTAEYYAALQQPENAETFIASVRHTMEQGLLG